MTEERQAIEAAIPHRSPMLLVDRIVSQDESSIVCEKTFAAEEFFVQGHYPDFPIVPGVILCECAMQTGAILLSQHTAGDSGVPVATRMSDVKFKRMVRPGETVTIQASLNERMGDAFFMKATVKCEGKLAARLDFACALAPHPAHE